MMCEYPKHKLVFLENKADKTAHTPKWRFEKIDHCIADIVGALNGNGQIVPTMTSCCGHGYPGFILLRDGRALLILDRDEGDEYMSRLYRARAEEKQ